MHTNNTVSSDASPITIEKENVQEDSTTARACSSDSPPATASSVKEEPQPEGEAEVEYVTGIPLYLTLFGLTLVAVLVMMDQTILVVAIPHITNQFNSLKDIGWYGSAYMLAIAATQPLMGKFYQFYVPKLPFMSALAIFELGSLICALAQSSDMFIAGRAVSGMGGAGLLIGLITIIASSAPLHKRPCMVPDYSNSWIPQEWRVLSDLHCSSANMVFFVLVYFGIVIGSGSIGLVLGPVLGGIFTEEATWRWCFYINLPLGAITGVILAFIHIPDGKLATAKATWKQQVKRLDLPGFLLFTPTCTMLLLALEWGGTTYSWKSATIIGLFCGSVGLCVVFVAWEYRRGETAMIPLSVVRNRYVAFATITTIVSQGSLLLITYYLPVWFQVVKNVSPIMGGVDYLPSVFSQVFASVLTGALSSRTGYYTPFAIVGTALTSVATGLLSTLTPHSSTGRWVGFQLISGFSRGMTMQQPISAVQAALPKESMAVGNAFLMFSQILGGAIFVSLGQTIFSNQLRPALRHFAPTVDVEAVYAVGATAFRTVVTEAEVPGVVLAYNQALTRVFYLGAGAAAAGFTTSWGLGWTNLREKKAADAGETKV